MSETSSALERLIQKTRPFKTFTLDLGDGDTETYQVRRTSVLENEAIAQLYTETYDAAIRRYQDDETVDYSVLRRSLVRQSPEDLAKYITEASKSDIEADVLDLYDGDEEVTADDPKIVEKVKTEMQKMVDDLKTRPVEQLMETALEKREHILALFEANRARMRRIAALTVYTIDGVHLFANDDEVGMLDEGTVEKMIRSASEALTEKADPLK